MVREELAFFLPVPAEEAVEEGVPVVPWRAARLVLGELAAALFANAAPGLKRAC